MDHSSDIVCWDRAQGRPVEEKVLDEGMIRWLYGTLSGRMATDLLFSRRSFSKLYAWWMCQGARSRKRIAPFVKAFAVDLEEFEARDYASFNEFFARGLRPGVRPFEPEAEVLPAFAEGACLAWEAISAQDRFPVKGEWLRPEQLIADEPRSRPFRGGPAILLRLRPQDYHRFHYVDAGPILDHARIPGRLHTVNPLALSARGDILCRNERHVSIQETQHFGRVAYVEIGAMTVGRIVQRHTPGHVARRGDEKGYFLCGGSTLLLFGEPGRWRPDADLIARTQEQTETLVRLGTRIASSAAPS